VASPVPPRVSVLIPVFNAATTLAACLHSVRRQTLRSWECVVADDGSEDQSLAVARRFADRDPRFVVVAGPHRRLVGTLCSGLARCRGRYVARMDADDLMHRERLAAQHDALERDGGIAAVGCRVRVFPRRHLGVGRRAYERWLNAIDSPLRLRREAFVECPIAHPALMIRREVLCHHGYRDRGWPEDYDLVLRLLAAGRQIGIVPRRLLAWRDRPGRLSRIGASYAIERFTACKAHFLARGFLADSRRYVLWGYGATGRSLRRALLAHGKEPSHIVEVHPRRLGTRIHDAPVIAPEELRGLDAPPIIASVAGVGPREEIRAALRAMEFRELRDFVCAA
jgi:glycosyltransferase involved in cell wall biosynthesis